jgi:hypothetical protein
MDIKFLSEDVKIIPVHNGAFQVNAVTEPEQLGIVLNYASDADLLTILEGVNEKRIKTLLNLTDAP